MRAVNRAIWTSGDPVSPAARWYCWTISAFCVTVTDILCSDLSLRERRAFYLGISAFDKPFWRRQRAQDAASKRLGCSVPPRTSPAPRNPSSSPKTATFPSAASAGNVAVFGEDERSEEHTSELQSH